MHDFLDYLRDLRVDKQTKAEMLSLFSKEYSVKVTADQYHSIGTGDQSTLT
jgi:hypothetical protein